MGAKRASNRKQSNANANANFSYNNVVNLNTFQKPKTVHILPRNKNQETYVLTLLDPKKDIVFGIGPAGTGKTMLACCAAVESLRLGKVNKIVITRPVVSVDEDIGFLPGSLESKMDPWTRPIFDVLKETYTAKEIEYMTEEGVIEIVPLGFMRGRTFKNAWIIADEMQNSSPTQMFMLATRIGEGSKMIITGDLNQSDLNVNDNGLLQIYNKLRNSEKSNGLNCVRYVELDKTDVQRSRAAKMVLNIYDEPIYNKPPEPVSKPQTCNLYVCTDSESDSDNNYSNEFEYMNQIPVNESVATPLSEYRSHISQHFSFPEKPNSVEKTEAPETEWVDLNNDAALIPLRHIQQLSSPKRSRT